MVNKKSPIGLHAYFTVEASLLIPFIIWLYLFLFFTAFYLYDRCLLVQDLYLISFRGSVLSAWDEGYGEVIYGMLSARTEEEIDYYLKDRLDRLDKEQRLPAFIREDISVKIEQITSNNNEITPIEPEEGTGEFLTPARGFLVATAIGGRISHYLDREKKIIESSQATVINPISLIREARREKTDVGN